MNARVSNTITSEKICHTTCPYCGVGCGVEVTVNETTDGKKALSKLEGNRQHPANFGQLCVKGSNLLETNDLSNRLLHPSIDGKRASWPDAYQHIADKLSTIIKEHGPDAVAFYVSGQLLTEDYYVVNKLAKGYLGTANVDTNSRLCMSSAVSAYKRAFGEDIVPCDYQDLENTDLLVLIGSNAAWTHPILFQRMEKAKKLNPSMKIVHVDPRANATTSLADLHLAIKPGSDAYLFNGLLAYIADNNALDNSFIETHTDGFNDALACATLSVEEVAQLCDVPIDNIRTFYSLFVSSPRAISFYSMGINQSNSGVDKANSIINCHLASGKIGKEGSGPFSITGQPNAMGGREVGGLANMLAAHMDIENPKHREKVKNYWQSPTIATNGGLKAVDLFDAIENGKVKAVWIMATNPLVSMPNRNKIERALAKAELVVVSDVVEKNDTLAFADVKLPATAWSEKDGTVTNSERRVSRQQGLLIPPGEAKHDWQIISEFAQTMGFNEGFNFSHPSEVYAEHAGLSGHDNHDERYFNISAHQHISKHQYNTLRPFRWPLTGDDTKDNARVFSDGKFYTDNGRAKFMPILPRLPEQATSDAFPFVLNTGRLRDQWHTMTRTGKAGKLTQHIAESCLYINANDADALGVIEGEAVYLSSQVSEAPQICLPVKIDNKLREKTCFAPIHWNQTFASSASIARLFTDARDPLSGQPELKHAAIQITKVPALTHIQVIQSKLDALDLTHHFDHWQKIVRDDVDCIRALMTQEKVTANSLINKIVCDYSALDCQVFSRITDDLSVVVLTKDDIVKTVIVLSNTVIEIEQDWLAQQVYKQLDDVDLGTLLRGIPDESFTLGRQVCSCFNVREKTIVEAISNGCSSVSALGDALQCGTNCGSCKSELAELVQTHTTDIPIKLVPTLTATVADREDVV
ncbi:nitrate reductase [Agaribacter marinus]|uniref:Nitrate reductase n=1 Tax=Agaribacter marinus TaxID=1431249 RepID=A0AA37SZN8_9ALTE|nr:nitrate reductase [Agaribacter marinus]GLR70980.1 nitrate reductase [Agaribacter marinus]